MVKRVAIEITKRVQATAPTANNILQTGQRTEKRRADTLIKVFAKAAGQCNLHHHQCGSIGSG